MCGMSQFLFVVLVPDEPSATLTFYCMQHVLLKFFLCYIFFLDDSTPFKEDFIAMCEALNLNHDVLAKRNHKDLTVEHFHRFITIATEEHNTDDIFVPAYVADGYAWNSVPINGTYILRSILAIGCEFHLILDISLNALPKLMRNNGQAILDYLKLTDSSRHFSTSILKFLLIIVALLMQSAFAIIKIILF